MGSVILSISGDVDAEDIFGDGVNLAARLEALAATPAHARRATAVNLRTGASVRCERAHATPCGPDGLSSGAVSGWERRPDLRLKVNDPKVRRQF